MSRSDKSRTEVCDSPNARNRLREAEAFLEVATQNADFSDEAYANVVAAIAVMAGIAATDAACCHQLKKRSRSQSHRDAAALAEKVAPDGKQASKRLLQLLDVKDKAQYGFATIGAAQAKTALRNAAYLVDWAKRVLAG